MTKLAQEGGRTVEETVDRVMKKLMTRRVGALFSLKGQTRGGNAKIRFENFPVYSCVIGKICF